MTTLIRRLRLLAKQQQIIQRQQKLIDDMFAEMRRRELEHNREILGMASAWRIHMETPEIDLRDDLAELMATLGHQVAKLEEHVL